MRHFHNPLIKARDNQRLNIIFANIFIWLIVAFSQIFIHKFLDDATKKMLTPKDPIDWKIIIYLGMSALIAYFIMTKINQHNDKDRKSSQAVLENEMASIVMSTGGAFLLNAGISYTKTPSNNLQEIIIYIICSFSIYVLAYFLLSKDKINFRRPS